MIKVTDIAYVRFCAPDLDEMEKFLLEFGLHRAERRSDKLFMRGTDPLPFGHVTELGEPGFAGLGFHAESVADLERLGREFGLPVEESDAPGGGRIVRFTDPNGFPVDVVAGQTAPEAIALKRHLVHNDGGDRPRRGEPLRVEPGPSQVKRLGHCVINVKDFRETEAWYKERFGLVTSDEIEIAPGAPIGAFLRCDRGATHVDHHTLFPVGTGTPGFNHAAFEVANFDDLMAGHQVLEQSGRRHEWGVGRHILGSQIFDYWRDPWGHTVEHWTDGDLFNNETPPNVVGIDKLMGNQWGPEAPPSMGS